LQGLSVRCQKEIEEFRFEQESWEEKSRPKKPKKEQLKKIK
jgi:hypothetical protein